jgi:hypothetical protein
LLESHGQDKSKHAAVEVLRHLDRNVKRSPPDNYSAGKGKGANTF